LDNSMSHSVGNYQLKHDEPLYWKSTMHPMSQKKTQQTETVIIGLKRSMNHAITTYYRLGYGV